MAPSKGKLKFNKQTNRYEKLDLNPPLQGGSTPPTTAGPPSQTTVPTTTPKPTPKPTSNRPVRQKPKINMAEAKAQGWGNIASARPEGVGARASLTDVAGEEDASMQALLDVILGKSGGGGGVPRAQARQGGLQAARILEQAGRRGQQMYTQQGNDLARILSDIYNPMFTQQEQGINQQQQAAMDYLQTQYGANQQNINQATQQALAAIPTSTAYQNVPIVNLQQEQNPLLSALGAYGAGTESVQAQSAADAQMAQQLSDIVKGSAGQLSTAQQAVLDAAKSDIQTGGSMAAQQLALARQAGQAGINAEQMRALNELRGRGMDISGDIARAQQALMSQGIESLLGGMSEGALQRAKTVAEYGSAPKKSKPKSKPNKGKK